MSWKDMVLLVFVFWRVRMPRPWTSSAALFNNFIVNSFLTALTVSAHSLLTDAMTWLSLTWIATSRSMQPVGAHASMASQSVEHALNAHLSGPVGLQWNGCETCVHAMRAQVMSASFSISRLVFSCRSVHYILWKMSNSTWSRVSRDQTQKCYTSPGTFIFIKHENAHMRKAACESRIE